jgi:hypothetical protein
MPRVPLGGSVAALGRSHTCFPPPPTNVTARQVFDRQTLNEGVQPGPPGRCGRWTSGRSGTGIAPHTACESAGCQNPGSGLSGSSWIIPLTNKFQGPCKTACSAELVH